MAFATVVQCRCGKRFHMYVPKQRLIQALAARVDEEIAEADWAQIKQVDAEEEANGQIEAVEQMAAKIGAIFVDTREMEWILCPDCGQVIDPLGMILGD